MEEIGAYATDLMRHGRELVLFVALGGLVGALLAAWWRRLHADDPPPRTAAWLALIAVVPTPPLVVTQLLTFGSPFGAYTDTRGAPLALVVGVRLAVWVAGVYAGARSGALLPAPSRPPLGAPLAEAGKSSSTTVRSWSHGPSLVLAGLSVALVVPGLVLALFPRLRLGATTTVRLDGSVLELHTGARVVRRSLVGAAVEEGRDPFGTPILVITGPEGAVELRLGGTPGPIIERLRATLADAARTAPRTLPQSQPQVSTPT